MRIQNVLGSLRARFLRFHGVGIQPTRGLVESIHRSMKYSDDELFRYTSGRWIYNEQLRLSERRLEFDVSALKDIIAVASGRAPSDIVTFSKLSEGGFNRVFQTTFKDGRCTIARLPYPSTAPEHYTVASEVATLDYLRLHGIRTPEVYAWCSTKENPVGSEYIIMERLGGIPLGDVWYSMTPREQHKMMKQLVEWETRLMSLEFPAYGSIYYRNDLPSEKSIPLPGQTEVKFCIGPIVHYSWWHGERSTLNIDRGPWLSSTDIFRAVGERELSWTKVYAKSRLPYERLYREIYDFCKVSPDTHIENLFDYLKLVPFLGFSAGSAQHRPVMRHPDFQPNNILVSESNEITGLIDWQHCSILPLGLVAGIPKPFQNYGDAESEALREPQLDLPPNFDSLPPSEQALIRETLQKRLTHFLYAALTKRLNEDHYDAIFNNAAILHQRLFQSAGTPWEGDSITLRADMIRAIQNWRDLLSVDSVQCAKGTSPLPPIQYSDTVIRDTLEFDSRQRDADIAMDQMRHALGVDVLGWVPNSEYEAAKELAQKIKTKMLEAAETVHDATAVRDHFPFDDFDENA
ncbi:kinase-like domain-containing protein [Aspergillus coremiiformis]|uniref:Kinase-like domain-containing protein n=1 Tax=Aspergillus coremiiformis TaxID=138285 RepID=A0A5N6YVL0_9EURO|nr:kinase-like domain-containing protein [Aspergillus coremiiformis]